MVDIVGGASELRRVGGSRPAPSMLDEVRAGLGERPFKLPPKYFYDELGGELFDQICATPEYYLTRTEHALLERHAADIVARTEPSHIIEFGAGTAAKSRLVLDAWDRTPGPKTYWPFDVGAIQLEQVSAQLAEEYLTIAVRGLVGDYTAGLEQLPARQGVTLAMFLGSTLGNFDQQETTDFIAELSGMLSVGDFLLLGVDLHKDSEVLTAAYNDAGGLTARFNKNMLSVLNRELGADFQLSEFSHRAVYNNQLRQIEMYLDAEVAQRITLPALDMVVELAAGESILTEISRKFLPDEVRWLLRNAGLVVDFVYIDPHFPYCLTLAHKPTPAS